MLQERKKLIILWLYTLCVCLFILSCETIFNNKEASSQDKWLPANQRDDDQDTSDLSNIDIPHGKTNILYRLLLSAHVYQLPPTNLFTTSRVYLCLCLPTWPLVSSGHRVLHWTILSMCSLHWNVWEGIWSFYQPKLAGTIWRVNRMPPLHLSQWIGSVGWSDLWRIWFTEDQFRLRLRRLC